MDIGKSSLGILAGILMTSSVLMAKPEPPRRFNLSISYGENKTFPSGALENYDPLRFRFGFEFDSSDDFWLFNKYTITPFVGYIKEQTDSGKNKRDYDAGIDFGLKRIFFEDKSVRPFIHTSLGVIYLGKDLKEHKNKWNFHINLETGLEIPLSSNFGLTTSIGYAHISRGDKIWNSIKDTTTNANNEGNPGINTLYGSVGIIYSF